MASGQWAVVLRHVQKLFHGGSVTGLTEGQLLDRFVSTRDEVAFGAIVARHGPMVLGVCRGVLDDPHDVEDAFQATFLVLVRKAAALRDRDLLGQWLYGVARRVSLRARTEASRRRSKERPEIEGEDRPVTTLDAELRELQVVIREEVDRLSSNDRMAVVLCYLEGLTHEEAADRLGWPVGTVKGRLSRARDKLRDRLTRRGIALPAAGLASTLARGASASVPLALLRSTTRAATQIAAGKTLTAGIVSAQALALMEGVIGTMFSTQLKIGALALVAGSVVAVPGVLAYQEQEPVEGARQATAALPKKSAAKESTDAIREEEAKLSEEAMKLAEQTILDPKARFRTPVNQVDVWSRRIVEAQAGPKAAEPDRIAAILAHRDRMRKHVELVTELVKGEASNITNFDLLEAKYHLLEAERWLRDGRIEATAQNPAPFGGRPLGTGELGGRGGGLALVNGGGLAPGGGGGFGPVNGGGFAPGGGGGFAGERSGGLGRAGGVGMQPSRSLAVLTQNYADEKRNEAIRAKLEEKMAMNFPTETPLEDIKKYVESATQDEPNGFPRGLPIYVDPDGLKNAEVTMASTVAITLEGIPLRTTLRLILRQLGLNYRVDGGVVFISDQGAILMQEMKASQLPPLAK